MLNASASCLKQLIECGGSMVNHRRLTFFKVVEKAQHIMRSRAPDKSMDAWKDYRCAGRLFCYIDLCGWGGLKCGGSGPIIISSVNG